MDNPRSVLFFPAYLDNLPPTTASIRFRALWPAKYWPEAQVYPEMVRAIGDYDAYIFQKAYLTKFPVQMIDILSKWPGKVLAFDLCDADWLQSEEHERRLLRALPKFDFAVCPTPALKEWLSKWLPAHVIPDRLDLDEFTDRRIPGFTDLPSLIWFGYAHNIGQLETMWPTIVARCLPLTILSNELPKPWSERIGVRFVEWTQEGANAEIVWHDIALVPQISPYKSDNRAITAWALGVTVAATPEELVELLPWSYRTQRSQEMRESVHKRRDVRLSVDEWRGLIDLYYDRKTNAQARDRRGGCAHDTSYPRLVGSPVGDI